MIFLPEELREFDFQHPHMEIHNHPSLQLPLLASMDAWTHVYIPTCVQLKIKKKTKQTSKPGIVAHACISGSGEADSKAIPGPGEKTLIPGSSVKTRLKNREVSVFLLNRRTVSEIAHMYIIICTQECTHI